MGIQDSSGFPENTESTNNLNPPKTGFRIAESKSGGNDSESGFGFGF